MASLVVRVNPADAGAVAQRVVAIAGAEVHGHSDDHGRLIVTVEDGEGYSTADSILAVSQAQGVLGITIAYEYSGEDETGSEEIKA